MTRHADGQSVARIQVTDTPHRVNIILVRLADAFTTVQVTREQPDAEHPDLIHVAADLTL